MQGHRTMIVGCVGIVAVTVLAYGCDVGAAREAIGTISMIVGIVAGRHLSEPKGV